MSLTNEEKLELAKKPQLWTYSPEHAAMVDTTEDGYGYVDFEDYYACTSAIEEKYQAQIARLEAEVAKERKFHIMEQEMRIAEEKKSASAELSNKKLREKIQKVLRYCTDFEATDDLDEALAQQPSTEALDAYVAKLIPPGWRVVPIEPTANMLEAAWSNSDKELMAAEYRAMLKVAPLPPAPDQDKEQERWTM